MASLLLGPTADISTQCKSIEENTEERSWATACRGARNEKETKSRGWWLELENGLEEHLSEYITMRIERKGLVRF